MTLRFAYPFLPEKNTNRPLGWPNTPKSKGNGDFSPLPLYAYILDYVSIIVGNSIAVPFIPTIIL